jgi:hypothetical protein
MGTMVTVNDPAAQIINAAYNRMLQLHDKRGWAANRQRPKDGVLYHYTSADGLKGIIENDELWATSAYYLNDSAEILYGYRVLHLAIETWLKKNNAAAGSISRGLHADLSDMLL